MPLHIPILILQRTTPNLEQPHRHPRSHFRQLDTLVAGLHENMVSNLDAIFDILERHNPASNLSIGRDGFPGRKQVLQNLAHPRPEPRGEAFEDQMWIGLGDRAACAVGDVVAQNDIV